MKNKIIKTVKSNERNKFLSFIFSLLFTGLGQVYNGRLVHGAVFFIFRILSLLIIPIYIQYKPLISYINIFFLAAAFHLIITIVSPFEAFVFTLKNKKIPVKKYNSILFYSVFSLFNITILIAGYIVLYSFFGIEKMNIEKSSPLFNNKDFILIKKYNTTDYKKGELVLYKSNGQKISRIIAIQGDSVNKDKYSFYVNGIPLPVGTFNEEEMIKLRMTDYNDILSETNNKLKYPIRSNINSKQTDHELSKKIGKNLYLLVLDDRTGENFHELVNKNSIIGRIEGVIFTKNYKRLLLKPYIEKK